MEAQVSEQLDSLHYQLKVRTAAEVLRLAADRFAPRLVMATAFGAEGCILIDLIARNRFRVDVFTLDTGLFFPETYELWRTLERRYEIPIRAVRSELELEAQAEKFGDRLWERNPDLCCRLRKVEPLARALEGKDAWITAIRREQTPERASAAWMEMDRTFALVKVNPLVAWSAEDVARYVRDHEVPVNPLHGRGYPSIGCAPCTTPVGEGEDPRAGRWRGLGKRECGLHGGGTRSLESNG
jgi:thioredoxin-dependent adenylylsulfate APS reductase